MAKITHGECTRYWIPTPPLARVYDVLTSENGHKGHIRENKMIKHSL